MLAARRLVALSRRVPPYHVERKPDQNHAAGEPHQIDGGSADPEQGEQVERDPRERPADQDRRPDEPETRRRRRHRDDPEALGAGGGEDTAGHEDEPHDQEHQKIGDHDLLERQPFRTAGMPRCCRPRTQAARQARRPRASRSRAPARARSQRRPRSGVAESRWSPTRTTTRDRTRARRIPRAEPSAGARRGSGVPRQGRRGMAELIGQGRHRSGQLARRHAWHRSGRPSSDERPRLRCGHLGAAAGAPSA